ncbi:MAG: aminotransferase class I/II-fold pyridoxal phosphate-dependent enzyme [Burkholderiaceae bacterium]
MNFAKGINSRRFRSTHPGHGRARRGSSSPPECWRDLPAFYQAKRDNFVAGLASTRLRVLPCEGTYFVLADDTAVASASEAEFARRLITEFGVAAIPVSAFYQGGTDPRVVRLCFAKQKATLAAGLERLQRL